MEKRLTPKDWHTAKFKKYSEVQQREMLHKLWELENKIENSQLVDMECSLGEDVYLVQDLPFNEITKYKITAIYYEKGEIFIGCEDKYGGGFNHILLKEFYKSYDEAVTYLHNLKCGII